MYIENIGLVDSDGNVTVTEEQLMHRKEGFWACHISKGDYVLYKVVECDHTYRFNFKTKSWEDVGYMPVLFGYDFDYDKISEDEALKIAGLTSWE